jgi:hypothetical protein
MLFSKGIRERWIEAEKALLDVRRAIIKPKVVAMVTDEHGQRWAITETPFRQRLVWFLYVVTLWVSMTVMWIVIPAMVIIEVAKWLWD